MNFPQLVQNNNPMQFPVWAKTLAKLGQYMAQNLIANENEFPRLAIVCLPRVDYAALFTTYGALCALATEDASKPGPDDIDLKELLGKKVSFLRVRPNHTAVFIGLLETIDIEKGQATIVTQRGRGPHIRFPVNRNEWFLVRSTEVNFDLARGATDRQCRLAGEAYRDYHKIEKTVGPAVAWASSRTSIPYVTVVGEKNRIVDECESLQFEENGASLSAEVLLNLKTEERGNARNGGRWVDLLASGRDLPQVHTPLVIIEAGRRVGDQLQQLMPGQRAIILVAANKRAHNDVVDLIAPSINFGSLHTAATDLGEVPHYIRIIFIQ